MPTYSLLQQRSQQLAGWSLVLSALVLPFSTALLNVFSALVLLGWLFSGQVRQGFRTIANNRLLWPLVLLIFWVLCSVFWTEASWSLASEALAKWRKAIFCLVVFLVVYEAPIWRHRVLTALYGALTLLAIICVCIWLGVPGFPEMEPIQGAVFAKSHIAQGYMMAILLILSAHLWLSHTHKMMRISAIVSGTLAIAVNFYMANGRTGYVCIAVAVVVICFLVSNDWRKRGGLLLAGILALGVVVISSPNVLNRSQAVATEVATLDKNNAETSSGQRLRFWQASWEMFKENPILGVGAGAWGLQYCEIDRANGYGLTDTETCQKELGLGNSHSDFCNLASQFGFVGLGLWLAFGLGMLWHLWKQAQIFRAIGIAILATYVAGAAFNTFIWDNTEGMLSFMLFALLLSVRSSQQQIKS